MSKQRKHYEAAFKLDCLHDKARGGDTEHIATTSNAAMRGKNRFILAHPAPTYYDPVILTAYHF